MDKLTTGACLTPLQDHLTLLNGQRLPSHFSCNPSASEVLTSSPPSFAVYNAFVKHGGSSSKWCSTHRLNFQALSRALTIRVQLKKYLVRFLPKGARIESCEGDHARLRRCLGALYLVPLLSDLSYVEGEMDRC